MTIETNKDEVVFRLSGKTNIDDLQDMADLLAFKEIAEQSKATQTEVDQLVKTVKKGRWEKTKREVGLRELS